MLHSVNLEVGVGWRDTSAYLALHFMWWNLTTGLFIICGSMEEMNTVTLVFTSVRMQHLGGGVRFTALAPYYDRWESKEQLSHVNPINVCIAM